MTLSLAELIGRTNPGEDTRLRQALVVAAPSAGTCTIRFGDLASTSSADDISGVHHLANAPIVNGDTVWALQTGGALLIIGRVATISPADVVSPPARMGPSPVYAGYSSWDHTTRAWTAAGNYVLLADNLNTFLNAPTTGFVHFRINNNEIAQIDAAGLYVWGGVTMTGSQYVTGNSGVQGQLNVTGDAVVTGRGWFQSSAAPSIVVEGAGAGIDFRRRDLGVGDATDTWAFYNQTDGVGAGIGQFRLWSGGDRMSWRMVSGALDWRVYNLPIIGGAILRRSTTGSDQIGPESSSIDTKTDIKPLGLTENTNPIWQLKPVRFFWDPTKVANADEINKRLKALGGMAGVLAEDVIKVMPDAVHVDAKGKPVALEALTIQAYLIDAVHHCHDGLKRRVAYDEGQDAVVAALAARVAALEALVAKNRASLDAHQKEDKRHTGKLAGLL